MSDQLALLRPEARPRGEKLVTPAANGHHFDEYLRCACGRRWADHQTDPTECPLTQRRYTQGEP